ncbi:MAG: acyl-CoA dehydrogenase family protein [Pseudomonadota bacterium]
MLIMKTLATERLALAAIGCGLGMRALEIANGYASARKVEGKPLRFYGQIQRHLAESYAELKSARALTYCAAAELEITGETLAPMADAAKLSAASAAENATHRAIQVLGGNGYIADFDVERLWRDARLLSIGGGSNEALQKNITRALARHKGRLS